ncbi:hypothetical protein MJO28_005797 [Puccinia striiformis f. sp. tritici]|uniref:Secreted protein n=4 Tax=Puccinia striiformis TaxID=27350 RepID=A0A0L0UZ45_9BASI|nr:hypothetical protein Pst134EA_009911 [Puccinia striiformis f. sp. tritici]KNE92191.1 hypothetical protein PSTG_14426 [Puccinia striiformis f. sp. tritici PST-78]POW03749.1 hypothetical protein PSHT_11535 [Puccinia striiformis]KAH9458715.1 hypothetical protein Pst134EB_011012 [Puccinia striiformis f. sp. tritici]KAH9469390.1 hypothetical protein Pst134EA_009911 [Puccinia striiformis f. sp. tritici]KAI7955397.1 hypothetical protein MJO28_005797 [Puccinia striiformis f. sp. tritici]
MKFLAPVTALMVLISGLVHGQDIVFDKWCADKFGFVKKPWAICGSSHYLNDDPNTGVLTWSIRAQSDCNLPNPIPFCCPGTIHDRLKNASADKPAQVDGIIMLDDCHKLA